MQYNLIRITGQYIDIKLSSSAVLGCAKLIETAEMFYNTGLLRINLRS